MCVQWQQENEYIPGTVATLAALALATNRTLVLPTFVGRWRFLFSWEFVDVRFFDAIGVGWRENSFLSNPRVAPRLQHQVARLHVLPDGVGVEPNAYGEAVRWHTPADLEREPSAASKRFVRERVDQFGALAALFAVATAPLADGGVDEVPLVVLREGDQHNSPLGSLGNQIHRWAGFLQMEKTKTGPTTKVCTPAAGNSSDAGEQPACGAVQLVLDVARQMQRWAALCQRDADHRGLHWPIQIMPGNVCQNPQFGVAVKEELQAHNN